MYNDRRSEEVPQIQEALQGDLQAAGQAVGAQSMCEVKPGVDLPAAAFGTTQLLAHRRASPGKLLFP